MMSLKSSRKYNENNSNYYFDYNCRNFIILKSCLICFFFLTTINRYLFKLIFLSEFNKKVSNLFNNELIKENFFVLDSNNLEKVESHLFGFFISKEGIITDNYYKEIGNYEEPEPQGTYILIRKFLNKIIINQDFNGGFGLYFYFNKKTKYFAISNSFLLLEEYLIDKQKMTFNKDFANNYIVSELCTPSIHETMINEIIKFPSNTYIIINILSKNFKVHTINYNPNTIPLESKKGLEIIDKWADKWGYIIRSLSKKSSSISLDLSGGFDTRTTLSILLNSGIDMNGILIKAAEDNNPVHIEDYKISSNISSKYKFKLNNIKINKTGTIWSARDSLLRSMYSKLGFHKEYYHKSIFYNTPLFTFTGAGGEILRGNPGYTINKYIDSIASNSQKILNHEKEFYDSSLNLCKRSVFLLKKDKAYNNEYEISSDLYLKGRVNSHFGKKSLDGFIINSYFIQPLIDTEIKKIKYDINGKLSHDLLAYIYVRFSHDLIYFPFQGNRILNNESIKKAEKLNKMIPPYKIKSNYNKNFFIDTKRKSPISASKCNETVENILYEMFKKKSFIKILYKVYDKNVYNFAKEYYRKSTFFPLKHIYGLLSIVKTIKYLSINKNIFKL